MQGNQPEVNQSFSNPVIQLPSKSNNFLVILLSILLFISVAIAGFFAYQTQKLVKELTAYRLQPTTTQTPTPTPDPTVNWKTYKNNKCGYSMKYPPDWRLSPELETGIVGIASIYANNLKIQIGCGDLEANETPEKALARLNGRDTGYGVSKFEQIKKVTVDGKLVYSQINIPNVGESVFEYYVFYSANRVLNIGFSPANNIYSTEIDQILSTFKFLD